MGVMELRNDGPMGVLELRNELPMGVMELRNDGPVCVDFKWDLRLTFSF